MPNIHLNSHIPAAPFGHFQDSNQQPYHIPPNAHNSTTSSNSTTHVPTPTTTITNTNNNNNNIVLSLAGNSNMPPPRPHFSTQMGEEGGHLHTSDIIMMPKNCNSLSLQNRRDRGGDTSAIKEGIVDVHPSFTDSSSKSGYSQSQSQSHSHNKSYSQSHSHSHSHSHSNSNNNNNPPKHRRARHASSQPVIGGGQRFTSKPPEFSSFLFTGAHTMSSSSYGSRRRSSAATGGSDTGSSSGSRAATQALSGASATQLSSGGGGRVNAEENFLVSLPHDTLTLPLIKSTEMRSLNLSTNNNSYNSMSNRNQAYITNINNINNHTMNTTSSGSSRSGLGDSCHMPAQAFIDFAAQLIGHLGTAQCLAAVLISNGSSEVELALAKPFLTSGSDVNCAEDAFYPVFRLLGAMPRTVSMSSGVLLQSSSDLSLPGSSGGIITTTTRTVLVLYAEQLLKRLSSFPASVLLTSEPEGMKVVMAAAASMGPEEEEVAGAPPYWHSWEKTPAAVRAHTPHDAIWSVITLHRFTLMMRRWGKSPVGVLRELLVLEQPADGNTSSPAFDSPLVAVLRSPTAAATFSLPMRSWNTSDDMLNAADASSGSFTGHYTARTVPRLPPVKCASLKDYSANTLALSSTTQGATLRGGGGGGSNSRVGEHHSSSLPSLRTPIALANSLGEFPTPPSGRTPTGRRQRSPHVWVPLAESIRRKSTEEENSLATLGLGGSGGGGAFAASTLLQLQPPAPTFLLPEYQAPLPHSSIRQTSMRTISFVYLTVAFTLQAAGRGYAARKRLYAHYKYVQSDPASGWSNRTFPEYTNERHCAVSIRQSIPTTTSSAKSPHRARTSPLVLSEDLPSMATKPQLEETVQFANQPQGSAKGSAFLTVATSQRTSRSPSSLSAATVGSDANNHGIAHTLTHPQEELRAAGGAAAAAAAVAEDANTTGSDNNSHDAANVLLLRRVWLGYKARVKLSRRWRVASHSQQRPDSSSHRFSGAPLLVAQAIRVSSAEPANRYPSFSPASPERCISNNNKGGGSKKWIPASLVEDSTESVDGAGARIGKEIDVTIQHPQKRSKTAAAGASPVDLPNLFTGLSCSGMSAMPFSFCSFSAGGSGGTTSALMGPHYGSSGGVERLLGSVTCGSPHMGWVSVVELPTTTTTHTHVDVETAPMNCILGGDGEVLGASLAALTLQRCGRGFVGRRLARLHHVATRSSAQCCLMHRVAAGFRARRWLSLRYRAVCVARREMQLWELRQQAAITVQKVMRGFSARLQARRDRKKVHLCIEMRIAYEQHGLEDN